MSFFNFRYLMSDVEIIVVATLGRYFRCVFNNWALCLIFQVLYNIFVALDIAGDQGPWSCGPGSVGPSSLGLGLRSRAHNHHG